MGAEQRLNILYTFEVIVIVIINGCDINAGGGGSGGSHVRVVVVITGVVSTMQVGGSLLSSLSVPGGGRVIDAGGGHIAIVQVGWSLTLGVVVASSLLTLGVVVVVSSTLVVMVVASSSTLKVVVMASTTLGVVAVRLSEGRGQNNQKPTPNDSNM